MQFPAPAAAPVWMWSGDVVERESERRTMCWWPTSKRSSCFRSTHTCFRWPDSTNCPQSRSVSFRCTCSCESGTACWWRSVRASATITKCRDRRRPGGTGWPSVRTNEATGCGRAAIAWTANEASDWATSNSGDSTCDLRSAAYHRTVQAD